jgi:hypothetical protein
MYSASPLSSGSAIIDKLFFLFGVSPTHFTEEASATVSENYTKGSDTLISISEYNFLKSCKIESIYSSPVPNTICSPDSSTFVLAKGYDLLIFLKPSSIFGNSEGFKGSQATFTTASV